MVLYLEEKDKSKPVSLYAYIRWIEDHVDGGTNPTLAENVVQRELKALQAISSDLPEQTTPPERELLVNGIIGLEDETRKTVINSLYEIVTGIKWDNKAIMQGKPIPDQNWRDRTLFESMSGFQILTTLCFDRDLGGKGNRNIEGLFITWILYDALRDLDEDLSAGLILKRLSMHFK